MAGLLALATAGSADAVIMGKLVESDHIFARSTVMLLHAGFLETGRGQCSATLIGRDLVLTAAHCVVNLDTGEVYPANRFRIYFGNFHHEQGRHDWRDEFAREVLDVRPHEAYDPRQNPDEDGEVHDIALLRLKTNAPTTFQPVGLLSDLGEIPEDRVVSIAGYGNIKFYGDPDEPRSRLLRTIAVTILSPQSLRTGMVEFKRPTTVRTMEDYAQLVGGMAAGDSGGPGFVKVGEVWKVFGVASSYRRDIPSYENVPTHLDWLRETARALGSALP